MNVHLVHHYYTVDHGPWNEQEHDHTDAYATLTDAQEHAAKHGESVDTVAVHGAVDQFTPDECSLLAESIGGLISLLGHADPSSATVARLTELRVKAASLAFLGVVSDA